MITAPGTTCYLCLGKGYIQEIRLICSRCHGVGMVEAEPPPGAHDTTEPQDRGDHPGKQDRGREGD